MGLVSELERSRGICTEVPARATRGRFTAEYKDCVLREPSACTKKGELGALLHREGL